MEDIYEGPYYEISPIHGAINFLPFSELRLPIDIGHMITPDCEEYNEFVEMFGPSISRITLHPAGFLLRNHKGFWNIYPSGANALRDYVPVPEDHHKSYRFKNTSIFALKASGLAPGWFTKRTGAFWWQQILEVHDDKLLVRSGAWDTGWVPDEEWIDEKDIYAVRPQAPLWCDFFDNRGFYLRRGVLVEYKSL